MTRDEARLEIRSNWRQIIPTITKPAKQKANGETSYICPICGHGTHGDGLTINPRGQAGALKCFGCDFSGDILDLYQQTTGADYNTTLKNLAGQLGITLDKYQDNGTPLQEAQKRPETNKKPAGDKTHNETPKKGAEEPGEAQEPQADYMSYYLICRKRLETDPAGLSYLSARGISEETARRFWLGYDPDWKSPTAIKNGKNPPASPRLIIPITGAHYEARDIRPDHQAKPETGPDFRKMKEGRAATFNGKALLAQEVQEIFITEGAIDALSIIEAGGQAVGIASANRAQAFIDELTADAANGKKTAATFVICLDNDEKGQAAAQKIRDGLQRLEIPFISADICGQYKDPNEHLQKDRAGFIEAVQKAQENARRLSIDSGETDIDEFFNIVSTEQYKAIPTGIEALDRRLSGGFVNEWLVIINAAPGAGKTVLATQICENMARSGRKCLYFNFEMSKDQLIARSISRIMDGDNNMGALDILRLYKQDQKTKEAVFKAGLIYKQHIAPNMLYNPDGTGPNLDRITEAMEARARKAEAKGEAAPVVCIDYLQMIEGAPKEDVKETIKRAVYAFKQYAQKHHSIVICISAQSRAANNDAEARQDAGRDTSNIEYSADLQLQIMSDPEDEETRRLYVTKSRFAAPSLKHYLAFNFNGKQGRFIFDHETEGGGKKAGKNWSGRR